jgi:hypothetical protein
MTDPWDDAGRSPAAIVVTAGGLRVPVCVPASLGDWPGTPTAASRAARPAAGTEARYRGVGPRGYRRSDARLHEQVCEQLLLDPYLDAAGIVVRVSKGRVRLSGTVPNERMLDAAVAAASSVAAGAVEAKLQVAAGASARPSLGARAARRRTASKAKRGGRR